MRLKNTALLNVCLLSVTFWLHGGARAQSPLPPPLSLAPPPFDEASQPEPTRNEVSPGVVDPWKTLRRRGMTAKDQPAPAGKGDGTPKATEDVPQRTGISAQSPAARNSAPPVTANAPATASYRRSPAPDFGNPSPSGNYDGFTVGTDQDEETGQLLPRTRAPSKTSNVRQKHDRSPAPSDDQAEVEKLKTKLLICRGC